MKRIRITFGLGVLSILTLSACKTQNKIANTMPPKALAVKLPCFSSAYQSNRDALFGSGMGESLDSENAYRKASLESKSKIASQINYLLNRIVYAYDKKAHLSGEQIASLRIVAGHIANTQLNYLSTVCKRNNTNPETGKTISYLANQITVDQVIDAFDEMAEKDHAMINYNSDEMRTAAAEVLKDSF